MLTAGRGDTPEAGQAVGLHPGARLEVACDPLSQDGLAEALDAAHAQLVGPAGRGDFDRGDERRLARPNRREVARVCQFGLGTPSYIPTREFRVLRGMTRNWRKLVEERSRVRNRIQKLLDRNGLQLGGVLRTSLGSTDGGSSTAWPSR